MFEPEALPDSSLMVMNWGLPTEPLTRPVTTRAAVSEVYGIRKEPVGGRCGVIGVGDGRAARPIAGVHEEAATRNRRRNARRTNEYTRGVAIARVIDPLVPVPDFAPPRMTTEPPLNGTTTATSCGTTKNECSTTRSRIQCTCPVTTDAADEVNSTTNTAAGC